MCRKILFRKLSEYHGENVLMLSSPGFLNVIGFRSELAQSLHLVKNTDDDLKYCVDKVASAVTNEGLAVKIKRSMYHINIDKELVRKYVGDTNYVVLSTISSTFDRITGNDVDSLLPTNIPPSSIRATHATEQNVDL